MSNLGLNFGPNSHMFDDDDESEATRIFIQEQETKFKKNFPLPKDFQKPLPKTPGLKKVPPPNFDDTLDIAKPKFGANAELFEAKEELRLLRIRLKNANSLNDELKKNEHENSQKMNSLIDEIAELKKQKNDVKRELEDSLNQSSIVQSMTSSELDQYKRIAMKLYNWRIFDRVQIDTMKSIMVERGIWIKENRNRIYDSYKQKQPVNLEDDEADKLFPGSVLDYEAIAGIDSDDDESMRMDETSATPYNDTFAALGVTGPSAAGSRGDSAVFAKPSHPVFGGIRTADPNLEETAMTNRTSFRPETDMDISAVTEETDENDATKLSICDTTIGRGDYSSIDYENYEKIERLEVENRDLKSQLQIAQHKSKSAMLYQEQKFDLETKNNYLNKQLETTMKELCSLRDATARGIFTTMDGADRVEQAKDITDRVMRLQQHNERLTKSVADLEESLDRITADRDDLEETYAEEKKEKDELGAEYQIQQQKLREKESLISELRTQCEQLQELVNVMKGEALARDNKIAELQEQLAKAKTSAATDAGDTTQIFHMKMNPLELAREEMMEKEEEERSRKRKMSSRSEDAECCDPEAKRAKEERVSVLEEQLRRAELHKSQAVEFQSLARRYREVSTALTGYQIKMLDDVWQVIPVNGSEPEDLFTFKYENGQLMLISRDDHSSDPAVVKWKAELDRFIGLFQSVPAFLSKVMLTLLEEERQNDADQCQPSMSVLHE